MIERTLAIIKPDGMKHKEEILRRIAKSGLKIKKSKLIRFSPGLAAKFYSHVKAKKGDKIHQSLVEYMTSKEIMPMIIRGEDAVQRLRAITGHTDPEKAEPGTIRGDLGTDKMRIADSEQRSTRNLIHSSGSVEEAEREISYFF